ncbi:S8 family serine peptidase [Hymenobacter busanensis]|uniref:S8 family serine peptidase n=1 Tax=Hymenobacter busanensis TaxID=2607656 RepID=UPI0013671C16|nr:S8 family serine peptidase [Hymenobacter busanensis]QHJ06522.1 S8 family serine peptidase [Hymenobacter busanensis]
MIRLLLHWSCVGLLGLGSLPAPARPLPGRAPAPEPCWVVLRNKAGVRFDPATYFSPQAQARRQRQYLPPADSSDFPLRADLLAEVQAHTDTVLFASRWFNAVACRATPAQQAALRSLPGVRRVEALATAPLLPARYSKAPSRESLGLTAEERQLARRQVSSLGADALRQAGLGGRGLRIAVLDVGFDGTDQHPAFAQLRARHGIVATRDFVRQRDDVYQGGAHGTEVLSCLAGVLPGGQALGLASEAEYLLARTERLHRELFAEEIAWLAAAEWADRLGADIINSSLGYTDRRYFREQMNGRTSLVARAANLAARKGMLVVCAAGNDGDDPRWRLIGTPADADSALAVGGLDPDTFLATDFSSCGPAAGGRRKPNLSAFGVVVAAKPGGEYERTEGTSFASPLLAGLAACVWQQQRGLTAMQLFRKLEGAGGLYPYFDYAHGYGLPSAERLLHTPVAAAPSFDFQPTAEAVQVVVRPEATARFASPLPLFADSVVVVDMAQTSGTADRAPDPLGREEGAARRSGADNSPEPLPNPAELYCYWQIADSYGRLRRYQVLQVNQRNVLRVPLSSLGPGDVLRVHLAGYTAEFMKP